MIKIFKLSFFYLIVLFVLSCSSQKNTNIENNETPEYLYKLAMIELDNKNYDLAQSKFNDIEYKFPLSNEAIQSQIMDAFIDYLKMNYEESIFKFKILFVPNFASNNVILIEISLLAKLALELLPFHKGPKL